MSDRERGWSEVPVIRTWQLATGAAVVGLALSAGVVTAAGPWDSGQRKAERQWAASQDRTGGGHHGRSASPPPVSPPVSPLAPAPAPSAAGVLSALGTQAVPPAGAGPLAAALRPLLNVPALGTVQTASVVDTATGEQLYGSGAGEAMTPASTVKIATAAAVLSALGPDHRIATTVMAAPGADLKAGTRQIVLVGGGDPTLTARKPGKRGTPASGASLPALADDTARALKGRGIAEVTLAYDTSLYSGPEYHPIGAGNDNIARITPLMADEGRLDDSDAGVAPRTGDPAGDAARAFAGMLRERGIRTTGDPAPGKPAATAKPLAKSLSAPLSALVERMLTNSDNDIAEALARQTALAAGEPASFEGARKAVAAELRELGMDTKRTRFADGSGLNRDDKVSAAFLTGLLVRAADPARPQLRPVLTGLPVAGFTGTLSKRYGDGSPVGGLVRAKTGTLNGVNTLAGTVVDANGRLLAFAFMASGTLGKDAAESALDRLASAVTGVP
ncbi:D-alanyl-D-alanine carboxypeptidase/D-alanyl-D-alanine-endopeptidase [Streptomyces sp. A3M-1-3]|uniref:D-alanyl-D-alanine carboxypeptidase/D-alanyl-D-alanine endopeptidase n=1 Tax=Streptomyces sp. A3M-1-3 TaxID=2962044 RepID=UPI0020B8BAF7|nr:D-alanyl-D-alanine carboxypeptidase/D-alanyl-D-alanine-endopeptidase [Streptomyces sp. A3M-1-3]MCP3821677.1 D-alanyl-D-alanine carboxypeptidase/D-alanyl-D-alanine-endopeptidase [Streptomyces sp. A3M-1-3]